MTGGKTSKLCTRLFEQFMKLQRWSQKEEKQNSEFIESIENQARDQKKL